MAELFFEHEYRIVDTMRDGDDALYQVPVSISEIHANRRLLLESINLRILADRKSFSFNFTLQGNLISSAQEEEFSSFEKEMRDFEQQHPDVAIQDFLDTKRALPKETPFAEKVNQFKNDLVTTARTWA